MLQMAFIRALFQQASAEGSRSTALKPLGWLVGMLCAASIALQKKKICCAGFNNFGLKR
jgi:hypothetical protein